MLMRLFNSFDKHSLQKIHSQYSVQINLVFNHINENADTEFNHEVILFKIVMKKMKLIENLLNSSYNLQKVN